MEARNVLALSQSALAVEPGALAFGRSRELQLAKRGLAELGPVT